MAMFPETKERLNDLKEYVEQFLDNVDGRIEFGEELELIVELEAIQSKIPRLLELLKL